MLTKVLRSERADVTGFALYQKVICDKVKQTTNNASNNCDVGEVMLLLTIKCLHLTRLLNLQLGQRNRRSLPFNRQGDEPPTKETCSSKRVRETAESMRRP